MSPIIGAYVSMIPMREGWIFLSDTWGVPNLFAFARIRPACMHGLTSLLSEVSFCTVSGRQRIVQLLRLDSELDFSLDQGTEGGRNA